MNINKKNLLFTTLMGLLIAGNITAKTVEIKNGQACDKWFRICASTNAHNNIIDSRYIKDGKVIPMRIGSKRMLARLFVSKKCGYALKESQWKDLGVVGNAKKIDVNYKRDKNGNITFYTTKHFLKGRS